METGPPKYRWEFYITNSLQFLTCTISTNKRTPQNISSQHTNTDYYTIIRYNDIQTGGKPAAYSGLFGNLQGLLIKKNTSN